MQVRITLSAAGLQKKKVESHVLTKFGRSRTGHKIAGATQHYSGASAAKRAHFKYSGSEFDIIACLISRMMSRYRQILCRVAKLAYKISPERNKCRIYALEYVLQV